MSVEKLNSSKLQFPIKTAEGTVDTVELRKPGTGELRGVKLTDLLQMDVNAMFTVIPRISQPALTADDLAKLDPADFTDLAVRVTAFFVKRHQLEGRALTIEDAETS